VLVAIVSFLLSGFVIGLLARWAVPGPDPMPVWMTILIGVLGSVLGGVPAAAVVGTQRTSGNVFTVLLAEVIAATLLVIAYRRFVQHRPITGPDAHRPPAPRDRRSGRGFGAIFGSPAKRAYERQETADQLRKLSELRDAGVLTDEEFEQKKRELLARM
jgi:uncharacterized membrane protein YeaQ/YmgE (transglycosylase-associated protein family)